VVKRVAWDSDREQTATSPRSLPQYYAQNNVEAK